MIAKLKRALARVIRLGIRVRADDAERRVARLRADPGGGRRGGRASATHIEFAVYGERRAPRRRRAVPGDALVGVTPSRSPTAGQTALARAPGAGDRSARSPSARRGSPAARRPRHRPGPAFGRGSHPTTRLCLELLLERAAGAAGRLGLRAAACSRSPRRASGSTRSSAVELDSGRAWRSRVNAAATASHVARQSSTWRRARRGRRPSSRTSRLALLAACRRTAPAGAGCADRVRPARRARPTSWLRGLRRRSGSSSASAASATAGRRSVLERARDPARGAASPREHAEARARRADGARPRRPGGARGRASTSSTCSTARRASCPSSATSRPRPAPRWSTSSTSEVPDDGATWQHVPRADRRRAGCGCGRRGTTPREGALDVVIEPGQAFGTGSHATTRLYARAAGRARPGGRARRLGLRQRRARDRGREARLGARCWRATSSPSRSRRRARARAVNGVSLEVSRCDVRQGGPCGADRARQPRPAAAARGRRAPDRAARAADHLRPELRRGRTRSSPRSPAAA